MHPAAPADARRSSSLLYLTPCGVVNGVHLAPARMSERSAAPLPPQNANRSGGYVQWVRFGSAMLS
jgi:hypothetical protein